MVILELHLTKITIHSPQPIGKEHSLESDLALPSLYSIELSLSHQGLVLAAPTHPVISVLQHLSKKPWVQFDLNWSNIVEDFQTEWKYLSDDCVGQRLQFYVDLKESVAQQRNGVKSGFSTLRKYITKEFTCYFCTNKDDTIRATEAFSLTQSRGILPVTIETSLKISDWKEDNIFLYFDETEPLRTRLVTKYELLYPDFRQLGEKLIDQIDQFHLISKASNNILNGDLSTVSSFIYLVHSIYIQIILNFRWSAQPNILME